MHEARSRQAHQKAVLDRMLKALRGEEDVLITEAGTLDQPPAPDPAMPLLQQVYYDLDLFGDVVDDDLQVTIVRTVARLPAEVCDMVIEECRFIEVPEVQTIRPATRPRWLILLRPDLPAVDVPSLIARNIALVRHLRLSALVVSQRPTGVMPAPRKRSPIRRARSTTSAPASALS